MTYHLPTLAGHHSVQPHLVSCCLLLEQPNMRMDGEIHTFEKATKLLQLTTSGLAPLTVVIHPYEHLMAFKDTHKEITVENIERTLTSISVARDLERLEMQYFRVMGEEQYIPIPVVLSRVTELRVGCKTVVDAVTVPALEGLCMEPGFVGWTNFADTDLEPDTLFSVLSLLLRSQCQSTLWELEFRNVPFTVHIADVLRLCPALETIQFTFRYWQKFLDAAFGTLLRELRQIDDDGSLACAPVLMLVMLRIEHSRIPTVLSFFNEDMVKTMETRVPANPEGEHTFRLSIDVENPMALLPNCTCAHRECLIHCGKLGSCCTINIGLADDTETE